MNNNFISNDLKCPEVIQPIEFHKAKIVNKRWGQEIWYSNSKSFCGKILQFIKGEKFSCHMHFFKDECWYIKGKLKMTYFNLENADKLEKILETGDIVYVPRGQPHQIEALEDSEILEVSGPFFPEDNYRVGKGSSQILNQ